MQVTTQTRIEEQINNEYRVSVKGKFLYCGNEKFYIKGVTYGTFRPQEDGSQFPRRDVVEQDFRMMSIQGINSVRTYTVPPRYLLDLAQELNIKVMVGLPWEQHITFLDDTARQKDILSRVKSNVLACKAHPAILCFAVGNEIPAPIVRWYGKEKIEKFIKQLYRTVKTVDPAALVTYVNYPTTEYLNLSFLDFDCFNVYLESTEKLTSYLARLHNISGNRPLVLAEIGLDSMRNGEDTQAATLIWQIETTFAKGCAGMFVFAWTDEWWRGGFEIEDWDFGLVNRQREPKAALQAVNNAMQRVPFSLNGEFPFISVVVCTYNGATTIKDCLEGLLQLDYPAYEVIVVNDGSTDQTADIVETYPVKLVSTINQGLSSARNTGLQNAQGEIVAYIDDDAYPDPHWLRYLAYEFTYSEHAGIGGPNIAPSEDGPVAKCVANAPGGPVHVLLSDEIAEHIPGCNMSFRKAVLLEVGGFDPLYRAAGDDVDICWRIQKAGYTIGFHPSAMVWHHRRNSVKAYWKQQKGYGKAEALLEFKWPEKYNEFGHLAWEGRIYGNGVTLPLTYKKEKVFYGTWGTALFQSVYQPARGFLNALPLMPEWYLLSILLAVFASLGSLWHPLSFLWLLFTASVLVVISQATISAVHNVHLETEIRHHIKYTLLITLLHVIQPLARLYGRLKHGLSPWRLSGNFRNIHNLKISRRNTMTIWSEQWRTAEAWLVTMEQNLIQLKYRVKRGGNFDRWDIQAQNSLFTYSRGLLLIEEHGGGKQQLRLRILLTPTKVGVLTLLFTGGIAILAAMDKSYMVTSIMVTLTLLIFVAYIRDFIATTNSLHEAFKNLENANASPTPFTLESPLLPAQSETDVTEEEQAIELRRQVAFIPPPTVNQTR